MEFCKSIHYGKIFVNFVVIEQPVNMHQIFLKKSLELLAYQVTKWEGSTGEIQKFVFDGHPSARVVVCVSKNSHWRFFRLVFTAQCTIVQSAVLRLHVVRPSVVCPSVCNVGGSG